MFELIPSSDTREYLKKIGHTFNDFEKATLIYNNKFASQEEKKLVLRKHMEHITDKELKSQIEKRLIDMGAWIKNTEGQFEEAYISIPHPFRQEDLVRIVGTNVIGIVCGCKSDVAVREYDDLMKKATASKIVDGKETAISDYYDCQVMVDTYYDGDKYLSSISHEHVNPVNLEYANLSDEDKRKGYLDYINKTLFHNSMFGGTGRSSKRIPAVLEQVQKIWEKHSDLRLGQLLLNISEQTSLFEIEDEMLMDKIQVFLNTKK